ncbi:hypothetical protein GOP47_0012498 [Adiantum capillus-veneris]|uniref:Uncharacterized protein n=1 Tax=Adiantum capillus-veneris TaxID=13818 RepID=A0A9D4URA8_ADICA|nr:hypothetical protein GOP47_0012498 [Adiantum capillus-veneris]
MLLLVDDRVARYCRPRGDPAINLELAARRIHQMASRSTIKYTMDRVSEYIRDPLFWRGPIPANDVVHILEDFDVIRYGF